MDLDYHHAMGARIMTLQKVIFLDRDGVINRDSPDYIRSWEAFEFLPGSIEAIAALTRAGYALIVITNQSIIGRGMVPPAVLDDMLRRMRTKIEDAGGKIFDIYFCPHRPDEHCDCRKPEPGLIFQAKAAHGIDLPCTVMIGDNIKDVLCGQNAGCGATILVRSGSGRQAEKDLGAKQVSPTLVVDDLSAAADVILSQPPLLPVCC
jgi:D-glycero-D-manno-heptose 1,7-bisphosphate phosphatase